MAETSEDLPGRLVQAEDKHFRTQGLVDVLRLQVKKRVPVEAKMTPTQHLAAILTAYHEEGHHLPEGGLLRGAIEMAERNFEGLEYDTWLE